MTTRGYFVSLTFVAILAMCGCTTGGGGGGQGGGMQACSSDAQCDDGDDCTADACVNGSCVNIAIENCDNSSGDGGDNSGNGGGSNGGDVSNGDGGGNSGSSNGGSGNNGDSGGSASGDAFVTFTLDDGVYRIRATPGAEPENVSAALDAIAPGEFDNSLNISPSGDWLVLNSERFDPECNGYACLSVVTPDLSSGEAVRAAGEVIHVDPNGADPFSAIANGGDLIVFPASGGPNVADLYAITKTNGSWGAPLLLTGNSPYDYHSQPAISDDGSTVVFDCGDSEYSNPPAAICEAGTDGSGFRVVLTTEGHPEWDAIGCSLHHPDYQPDGGIVSEPFCQIWRLPPDSDEPVFITDEFDNDNSPCVLPDGRIASLWLDRPGGPGLHEIKIMDADGSNSFVVLPNIEVVDIGIGCGGGGSSDGASSSGDGGDSGGDGGSGSGGASTARFPSSAIWYEDVSDAPVNAQSSEVISWLDSEGGWGTGEMRIDFSIEVLTADENAPFRAFIPTEDHFSPDCDTDDVPVPAGGALEGESGYECTNDGDCHLIVYHQPSNTLYEMWRANIVDNTFYGGCLAVWDLDRKYPADGRGENCTSADAAGFPITPLLFTADEVASGSIDHAIRFILPNDRIRNRIYVHPATHSTGATGGPDTAPSYGARFRLRTDYPLDSLPSEGARVVARAMQKYGMFLADAGNIALTAQSDRFTTAKWDGLLDTRDLDQLEVSDFQMVESTGPIEFTGDCERNE